MELLAALAGLFLSTIQGASFSLQGFLLMFFPFVLLLELPYTALVCLGVIRYRLEQDELAPPQAQILPRVSCIITCYSEGLDVQLTILSLLEQDYNGQIEIIPVIDGATQNTSTYQAAIAMAGKVADYRHRRLRVLPKWLRGGRVSGLNTGLYMARGDIAMALDGDTSFDRDMVSRAVAHFRQPDVVAVAGALRVRNAFKSLVTRFQALEYLLSLQFAKAGLSQFNAVNNISGAFGVFRTDFLRHIGGWDNGTAEDLDITLRIKKYFGEHPRLRIVADPLVLGHTDAPDTFKGFFQQRLRWDGDLAYLYLRKHAQSLRPGLLGWTNTLMFIWSGLIFQFALPFLILSSLLYLLAFAPLELCAFVLFISYVFYLGQTLLMYGLDLLLISERPRQDLRLAWCLPLFPVFALATRIWSGLAILHSMLLRSHLDSSMAPWWVLRKGRF